MCVLSNDHVNGVISRETKHGGELQQLYTEIIKSPKPLAQRLTHLPLHFKLRVEKPASINSEQQHFCCNVCFPGSDSSPGH